MDSDRRYWWRIALELKLRQLSGDAFQDFFGRIMQARFKDGYVRVRPFGQLGDKGCDGYLAESGRVYQCYGAVNGEPNKVDYLVSKMETDFTKARDALGANMKEWEIVHNLVDGLPIHAVEKLNEIKKLNKDIPCQFVGFESIASIVLEMDEQTIASFLGPIATVADEQDLKTGELRDLISAILSAVDSGIPTVAPIKEVSVEKLAYNELPSHWAQLISFGWKNADLVSNYFSHHPDPMTGERVATRFRERYAYLKAQNLAAADIMSSLYEMIVGIGNVTAGRMVAAQALLAHLFESCDVLEDVPQTQASS